MQREREGEEGERKIDLGGWGGEGGQDGCV